MKIFGVIVLVISLGMAALLAGSSSAPASHPEIKAPTEASCETV